MSEPHPNDALLTDDLPNIVIDEEGFHIAAFRFHGDADRWATQANKIYPSPGYKLVQRPRDKGLADAQG